MTGLTFCWVVVKIEGLSKSVVKIEGLSKSRQIVCRPVVHKGDRQDGADRGGIWTDAKRTRHWMNLHHPVQRRSGCLGLDQVCKPNSSSTPTGNTGRTVLPCSCRRSKVGGSLRSHVPLHTHHHTSKETDKWDLVKVVILVMLFYITNSTGFTLPDRDTGWQKHTRKFHWNFFFFSFGEGADSWSDLERPGHCIPQ